MSITFYTRHKPIITTKRIAPNSCAHVYEKIEMDDHFLFRKTNSITINAKILDKVDEVKISIPRRNVTIRATKEEIKANATVRTFFKESKYHLPIESWTIIYGDTDWVRKIRDDNLNNNLYLPENDLQVSRWKKEVSSTDSGKAPNTR